ncbi:MAG TPA: HAD-IIIA family hydrolase [Acidobacteriota bacterium]|nr:HAD-IIIA family hydrolase [Acidobacteriota bacterium]
MRKRILVVRLGSLGDIILTSAPVLNLKLHFPDSELTYLTRRKYADIVRCFDGVDRLALLSDNPRAREYVRCLRNLDREKFDIVVDLHGNARSWLARRLISAGRKAVYPKRRLERRAIVRSKRIPEAWPHTIDLYNECVGQLGGEAVCRRPHLRPPGAAQAPRSQVDRSGPRVVVAPGAAHPNKQWPPERFWQVARSLHQSHGAAICWVVTGRDRELTKDFSGLPEDALTVLIDEPLGALASHMAGADLTIANDSGLAHLSSAVGTPVMAVFGPTHPSLGFAPRGLLDQVVEVEEFCRPCSLHGKKPCYREEPFCFTRIPVERVAGIASEILARSTARSPAVFVDRDGTVMVDKEYLSDPDEVELEPGAAEALKLLREGRYKLVIVSNQSGVARGYHGTDSVEQVNRRLLKVLSEAGVEVDDIYYCPHLAGAGNDSVFGVRCRCRKPSPGMAEEAAYRHDIDLSRSVVIGDSQVDYNLGRVIGGRSLLVRTGYGSSVERKLSSLGALREGTVFDNLLAAARHLAGEKLHA